VRLKLFLVAILSITLITPDTFAATPTPKSTTAPVKPTAAKSTSPSSTSSVKPSSKATTKKPVKKKKVKKSATPIPSPSPVWPPVGFTANNGIYAKIPSGKELLGLISAKSKLAADVAKCDVNACGAVIIASDFTCNWWEIRSTVSGIDPNDLTKRVILGNLRTTHTKFKPKTYANIILVSDEPLFIPSVIDQATGQSAAPVARVGISVGNISAICHKSETEEKLLSNTYTPNK